MGTSPEDLENTGNFELLFLMSTENRTDAVHHGQLGHDAAPAGAHDRRAGESGGRGLVENDETDEQPER